MRAPVVVTIADITHKVVIDILLIGVEVIGAVVASVADGIRV